MDEQAKSMLERAAGDGRHEFGSFFLSRLFGMDVTYDGDECTVSFEAVPQLFNPQGSIHGGVMATALDISMGHLLKHRFGAGSTLEMKLQYFAPVRSGREVKAAPMQLIGVLFGPTINANTFVGKPMEASCL